jgi:mycothiol system anti-sigma-R factor
MTERPDEMEQEPADCADVLASLDLFLDAEIDTASDAEIRRHLEQCAPCLTEFDLERVVKALVKRSCSERAPQPLRDRVMLSIRQVHVQMSDANGDVITDVHVVGRVDRLGPDEHRD